MAKPGNHHDIQSNREIREIFSKGVVQNYIKNYQRHDLALEEMMVHSYEDGWITIKVVSVNLSMEVIMEVNSLILKG